MKKIYTLSIAIIAFTHLLFAASDPTAKKILDEVSSKMKSYKSITAAFTIKSISSQGKNNGVKTGSITIKGKKYLLKQGKVEIKSDGVKVYNFDGSKTITVSTVEEGNQTLTPQNLFTNFYDKDFSYRLVSTVGNFNEIELIPNDKKKSFQKVNVFVDKLKQVITKAKIIDKNNGVIEFSLANLNTLANVSDNVFSFDRSKYPADAEILD